LCAPHYGGRCFRFWAPPGLPGMLWVILAGRRCPVADLREPARRPRRRSRPAAAVTTSWSTAATSSCARTPPELSGSVPLALIDRCDQGMCKQFADRRKADVAGARYQQFLGAPGRVQPARPAGDRRRQGAIVLLEYAADPRYRRQDLRAEPSLRLKHASCGGRLRIHRPRRRTRRFPQVIPCLRARLARCSSQVPPKRVSQVLPPPL
jgi:hypothetical protein